MSGRALFPWEPYDPTSYSLVYLSFGAGVQSSTLLALSALGLHEIPKVDVAIFADTQDEPVWVYEHLWQMAAWVESMGICVEVVSAGKLSECDPKHLRIPAFTDFDGKSGKTRRQCTSEYKIKPINTRVRQLLGLAKGEQHKGRTALSIQGISYDEMQRMKDPKDKFIDIEYPLVRMGWTRHKCLDWWLSNMTIPAPRKSACVYCPFRSNEEWRDIRDNDPQGWEFAIWYDSKIRDSSASGLNNPAYLHRSLMPLADVDIEVTDADQERFGFLNECEGM